MRSALKAGLTVNERWAFSTKVDFVDPTEAEAFLRSAVLVRHLQLMNSTDGSRLVKRATESVADAIPYVRINIIAWKPPISDTQSIKRALPDEGLRRFRPASRNTAQV